jgi:chromosome segregation ATPase
VFLLDEVEALRSSYEEIETGAMSMAKENTTLNEDKKVLASKNDELQRIAESLERRVSTNNSNKKEYEKLVTSLKEENSSLKNQLDSLQAECGRLKIEKADTAVALSLAESEKETLLEKLQVFSKELSAANQEKQEISNHYNQSLEDNSALKKEVEVLEEQMKLLRCCVEDNSAESKETEEKIQSMENTISILEKKIASDDDEMFSLKADLQIKTKEYDALKAEAEQYFMRLKDQEANWTEAQRTMTEELQVLRYEHASHEKELLQHMELIVQERHAKEDFEKKLAIANQELERSKKSFEELEQANVSRQMELTNLRAECEKVDKMSAEVQRLEEIRSQVIRELSIARENYKVLSEKLSKQAKDLSEEILQLEAERNNLLKSKKEASDAAYKLKAELNKVMAEKENLNASFESKMKMILTESNELKRTRESAEKEVEQKSSEIDRLNSLIQNLRVEIEKSQVYSKGLQAKIKTLSTEKSVVEVERDEVIAKDEESQKVIQSLKTHLKNAHAERSILESKLKSFGNVDQYKSQIECFEAQLRQTNNDLQNVITREKALKEELEGEYAKKEAEIRKLVQELEMERNKSATTMEDYAATTATVKELLSEVEDLQKREVELKKLIHSLETDLSDSNTSLQASTKDCMALKKKLDKVEKQSARDVDSLKKELKKHLETQEELLNEISGLKAKEEKLLDDYSNLQKQIATPSESQELLDKLRLKYQGMKEDHQSLQRSFVEKLQMFKEIVNNMRQEVLGIKDCRLKTSTLFIKAKYQSLFESNSDLAGKLDQLNTQNASLNLKIDELTQENQKLESRRDSLLEDLHAAQKSLEAAQQRLGEIQKQKQEFINAQKKRKTEAGNEENADSNKNPPIVPLVVHHERHVRRDSGIVKQAAPGQRRQILKKHDKDGYQECKQQ